MLMRNLAMSFRLGDLDEPARSQDPSPETRARAQDEVSDYCAFYLLHKDSIAIFLGNRKDFLVVTGNQIDPQT
jgi:hypothetical protein